MPTYYFTTSFYNISFIRYFIIQFYTLKQYLLNIKIIYYPLPHYHQQQQQQQQPTPQINRHSPQQSTTNISHCYQKKKSQTNTTTNINPYTQKKKTPSTKISYPSQISHPNPINLPPSTKISQPPTTKTTNHQKRKRERSARLKRRWSEWPRSCRLRLRWRWRWRWPDQSGDDRSGLAHAACAYDGNDDGDDLIRVASPMKMWSVSFCSFSVEGKAGLDVRRERKNQDQKWEESESQIKNIILVYHIYPYRCKFAMIQTQMI